jgi:eukaryotic-like serine/threonine-protein kinase
MALASGTKLGPYEIVAPLGAGGMGEVYRARDTRLDRTVAIKILPTHLSDNPEAKDRFDREARAISSLSHPNICHLYDVGAQDGTNYLVMEYLEGETLADRLRKGPLPLEQFLKVGIEICEGLEKAHRSGVIHRDLKPGNIMLTKNGSKLMDFGLAKAIPKAATPASSLTASFNTPVASQPLTAQGTVVGTFQYMAPEQLEGLEAEARSDLFSLGAVLYEMITGRRAFEGKSPLSVASAILEKEPAPISTIKPMTPPALDHAIRRCLAKDPEERWQTARDLGLELKWIAEAGSEAGVSAPVAERRTRERLAWATAALLALAAIGFAIGFVLRTPKPAQPMRLSAEIGADANLYNEYGNPSVLLSPDGTRLAFVASGSDEKQRIYVRSLDQLQATALSGTEHAQNPFFSPDSQWLGFFADRRLKKISVQGGAAVSVCDAANGRGGSWNEDGNIVFAPDIRAALYKVSSAGGAPQPLTTLDQQAGEVTERWPQLLPGGKVVLFTSNTHGGNYEDADIMVYSISSRQRKTVLHGGFYGRYLPTGHVAYMHEGTLFAVPFELRRLEVTGPPVPILDGVSASPGDASAQFSFSESGNMVYVAGRGGFQIVSIYWMDRQGKFTPLRETPGDYYSPAFSPDGKRLALAINDGKRSDIWVYEWAHDTLTRLTFSGNNFYPIWTPDGQRITYSSFEKPGVGDLYWTRADGTGGTLRLTETKNRKFPASWHPNGKLLAFDQVSGATLNTFTMTIDGNEKLGWKPGEAKPLWSSSFQEAESSFSPDGRWLAYISNETGDFEVYVRPFPGPGGKWQISSGGAHFPKWSGNGKELFYRTQDNKIMVATYTASGDSFRPDKPQLWSPGQFSERLGEGNFDLSPDGKRVVVLKAPASESTAGKVTFIFNFFDELRRKTRPQK